MTNIFHLPQKICKVAEVGKPLDPGQRFTLFVAKTAGDVVINQPGCLHMCIQDGATDKFETALFHVLAEGIRLIGRRWHLGHGFESVLFWFAINELPDVVTKSVVLILHIEKCLRVADGSVYLELVSYDARIEQNFLNALLCEACDFLRVEIGEILPVPVALVEYRRPTQTGLCTFQDQEFELRPIVPDRYTPFFVVVFNVGQACFTGPFATLDLFAHRKFRKQLSSEQHSNVARFLHRTNVRLSWHLICPKMKKPA